MKELIVIARDARNANNVAFQLNISNQMIYHITNDITPVKDRLSNSLVICADNDYLEYLNTYKECIANGAVGLVTPMKLKGFIKSVIDKIKLVNELYEPYVTPQDAINGGNNILESLESTILKKANGFSFKVTRLPNGLFNLIGNNDKSQMIVQLIAGQIENYNNSY